MCHNSLQTALCRFLSYLDVIGASSKNLFLRIFLRCRSYKVLSKIVLIKQLTMNLYSLISWMTLSTYRFTQECDCFQSYGDFFLFLKHIMNYVKTSGKIFIVDRWPLTVKRWFSDVFRKYRKKSVAWNWLTEV